MSSEVLQASKEICLSLGAACSASVILAGLYRFTHRRIGYEKNMSQSLVLLSITVCAIMMGIRTNLALSLGLVGALSIVRFRTAVKDSIDLLYFLIAICVGLLASTGDYVLLICSASVIVATILLLHLIQFGTDSRSRFTLIFSGPENVAATNELMDILRARFRDVRLCSRVPAEDNGWEFTVTVSAEPERIFERLEDVSQHPDVSNLEVHSSQEIVQV